MFLLFIGIVCFSIRIPSVIWEIFFKKTKQKHSTMLTFYCQNKGEYLKEALESCRHQIWFLFQNLILSCQETFLIGYNLSFLINGGKTLVTCIEECNTKYHRLSNDRTPTFCAYYFLHRKTIKMNLQSPWQ